MDEQLNLLLESILVNKNINVSVPNLLKIELNTNIISV